MKVLLQFGAGNIGRGFIGPLFCANAYHVSFVDVDRSIIDQINEKGCYSYELVSKRETYKETVNNISGIYADDYNKVDDAIVRTDIIATAVGVSNLPKIVKQIARGLKKRWASLNVNPLNIIICENILNPQAMMRALFMEELSSEEMLIFDDLIGLVRTSVGRMVPELSRAEREEDRLFLRVERYGYLPLDSLAFKGELPEVTGLYPYSPFDFFIMRKLFIHNMGHTLVAYLGDFLGYEYIWQAVKDPLVKLIGQRAMLESAKALSIKYEVPLLSLIEHIDDLLIRFANQALNDSVKRVARDTKRKLSSEERFIAATELCQEEGVGAIYISLGIACGIFYSLKEDESLKDLAFFEKESLAKEYVKAFFGYFEEGKSLIEILEMAEEIGGAIMEKEGLV